MKREVVVYDPAWPALFERIRAAIAPVLRSLDPVIEHVGSTAVPGLAAKPVIDIDVVVAEASQVPDVIDRLERVDYVHEGDLGIIGREALRPPSRLPYHHLYVVVAGSKPHQDHVLLRDYLRAHPDEAARYGARKLEVAHLLTTEGGQAYVDAKAALVEEMLGRARSQERPDGRSGG